MDPGAYLTADCRGNLRRMHEEFKAKARAQLRIGTEPEMMWLKFDENGKPKDGFQNLIAITLTSSKACARVHEGDRIHRKMGWI